MGIFKEIPPTAGFPLSFQDIFFAFSSNAGKNCLANDFQNYLHLTYAKVTYSGTSAFYLILEALKELSSRKTVIIPAYVCPLVALAIKRAGLKAEVCDIYKDDFSFSHASLQDMCKKNDDILAIVPVHLAGMPVDFEAVEQVARKYGIFIVEDCAQALGSVYKGKKVGTLGDFAFYSLCRGKGLTIYEGGVAVTQKEEYARIMEAKARKLFKRSFISESLKVAELFGYSIVYRPQLFWFVYQLPRVFWRASGRELKARIEDFTEDFPTHRVSSFRQKIGHVAFCRLETEINKQRARANFYMDKLKDLRGIRIVRESPDSRANYPYLTVLFTDLGKRDIVLEALEDSGMGVSQIYACSINEYPYLRDFLPRKVFTNARYMAEHSLTLSTSAFIEEEDMRRICDDIINLTQ